MKGSFLLFLLCNMRVFALNNNQTTEIPLIADNNGQSNLYLPRDTPINIIQKSGTIGVPLKGSINNATTQLYYYEYNVTESDALVVSLKSNAKDLNEPLLISTWTQWDIVAWRLPWRMDTASKSVMFNEMNRTMCPREVVTPPKSKELTKTVNSIVVLLSTHYPKSNLSFVLTVDWKGSFVLKPGTNLAITATPVAPAYIRVLPPGNNASFFIRADSTDNICMTIAIRSLMCEAFNEFTSPNLRYDGLWQSATTQASITVDSSRFPSGILLEIFVEADDSLCQVSSKSKDTKRMKTIHLTVVTLPSSSDLAKGFAIPITLFVTLGLLALLLVCLRTKCASRRETSYEGLSEESGSLPENERTDVASAHLGPPERVLPRSDLWHSLLVQRESTKPSLADVRMAFKDKPPTQPATYRQSLLLAAFSHLIAAVPLAIAGLHEFNTTGNQDTCAFNFRCAVPWGPIPDINHVISNIGYIVLGFMLLLITYLESEHWESEASPEIGVKGIDPQFGLFWCLAVNMIAAGVVSAAYHLCPSKLSYELDMSFLYALVLHMMLSLYRRRHPNFGVSLPSMWKTWAAIEAAALAGLHAEDTWGEDTFWTCWTTLHLSLVLILAVHIYYAGVVELRKEDIVRLLRWQLSRDPNYVRLLFPLRFFVLLLAVGINAVLALYAAITQPPDVPAYVLLLLVINLLYYTLFYVLIKSVNGERLTTITWIFLVVAMVLWILALIAFCQPSITWESTPAQSRAINSECSYLEIYDAHDVWHFLSSAALFFLCLAFLSLDCDLRMVPFEKITVF